MSRLTDALNNFGQAFAAASASFEAHGQKVLVPHFEDDQLVSLAPERIDPETAKVMVDQLDWRQIGADLRVVQEAARQIGGVGDLVANNLAISEALITTYTRSGKDGDRHAMLWSLDTVFKNPDQPDSSSMPNAIAFLGAFVSQGNPVLNRFRN